MKVLRTFRNNVFYNLTGTLTKCSWSLFLIAGFMLKESTKINIFSEYCAVIVSHACSFTKMKTNILLNGHLQRSCFCIGKQSIQVHRPIKYESPTHGYSCSYGARRRLRRCERGSIYLLIHPLSLSPLHFLISSLLIS